MKPCTFMRANVARSCVLTGSAKPDEPVCWRSNNKRRRSSQHIYREEILGAENKEKDKNTRIKTARASSARRFRAFCARFSATALHYRTLRTSQFRLHLFRFIKPPLMIPAALKPTMDSVSAVLRFFTNQKTKIGYGIMAVATVGGERIFSLLSFQCPCNVKQNLLYGLTYLFGPAVVLFTISLFLSTRLWRLYTGCCLNPRKLCPHRGNCLGCLFVLFKVTVGALVAPVMWLSIALLNGTFYECAVSGMEEQTLVNWFCKNRTSTCKDELDKVPCGTSNMPVADTKELLLILHAQSQILGWILIMSWALAALIGMCYKNCRSQVSYLQLTFWKVYKEKEREKFESFAEEYATRLAERNLKSFFENKDPESFPFPNHIAWEQISTICTYSHGEQSYSTLQKYVEHPNRDYSPEKIPLGMEHNLE